MIVRVLRARVRPGKQDDYLRFLRREALPLLRSIEGVGEVRVGTPTERSPEDFMITSHWESLDDLRTFAGERWFQPRVFPAEAGLVRSVAVHHYELADDATLPVEEETPSSGARSAREDGVLVIGPLRVDLFRGVASVDGEEVELPPREFLVLTELARRPLEPLSADELASALWPGRSWLTGDEVRRIVYRLRRLLGDDRRERPLIRNRRGYGYLLDLAPGAER